MEKPKGGRGKTAPYETTHVRVPIPVKSVVEKIIDDYRLTGTVPTLDNPVNGFIKLSESKPKIKDEILSEIEKIRKAKKIGKDTINQILELIYGGQEPHS